MRRLKCDSCGADLMVDDTREFGFCQYCGAKFILNEKVNVNVTIDNKNDEKIDSAYNYISEGNFEKAEKLFKNVLEDDPKAYSAWWGRFICERYYANYYGFTNRYGETSKAIKKQIISEYLQYAYNAIKYAPTDRQEFYKNNIADDENFLDS